MKTQNEISLLAGQELDAVTGGRMNNGIGQIQAQPKYTGGGAVSAGNSLTGKLEAGTLLAVAAEIVTFMAFW